mmetsp:Transcript_43159/g.94075  ORF Transcript_43159/g.94075 Transcript_43159/m.94075 type:complete len:266 (-) Transcript_43159:150-947(-)
MMRLASGTCLAATLVATMFQTSLGADMWPFSSWSLAIGGADQSVEANVEEIVQHTVKKARSTAGSFLKGHATSNLASLGLEEGGLYKIRLGKEVSGYGRQRGGWYLGYMPGNSTGKPDRRDNSSSYVAAFEPGKHAFNQSRLIWKLEAVPGGSAIKISQPHNGWYLTARPNDPKDMRTEKSSFALVVNPKANELPEHDGEWLLQKNLWGAFKLTMAGGQGRYLTVHRRGLADQRGREATYASVIEQGVRDVPPTDGRWIFEKIEG